MHYKLLACDYDGTLATDGVVPSEVWNALDRVRRSGRKVALVTGRQLPDLLPLLPSAVAFDRIVAENGALIYDPQTQQERLLAAAPPAEFLQKLLERGVPSLSKGRVIVATQTPFEKKVLDVIRDLGLELTLSFNKGSVMILPSGVNKGTGLTAALSELGIPGEQVVGVGDAENDHSFLEACGCFVAVANALPALKKHARLVTTQPAGKGVCELIGQLLANDLANLPAPSAIRLTPGDH